MQILENEKAIAELCMLKKELGLTEIQYFTVSTYMRQMEGTYIAGTLRALISKIAHDDRKRNE